MGYENAPQTRMLATHCCVCGRPLCDADSVTQGIGPECRGGLDVLEPDQRRMANQLTHAAALYAQQGRIGEVRRCADALETIGCTGLAELVRDRFKSAEANADIEITRRGDVYAVKTPFRRGDKDAFIAAWRAIPGRTYSNGANHIPVAQKVALWALLRKFFPGKYGTSDEGVFRIPA